MIQAAVVFWVYRLVIVKDLASTRMTCRPDTCERVLAELKLGISYLGDEMGPFAFDHHACQCESTSAAEMYSS
jgi:hypothetical protein